MTSPRFSVVILLPGARGLAARCVRGWTAGQDFPRDRYEVLVADDGSAGAQVRSPGGADRLVEKPRGTRTELFDLGARAARGEFLVFTESHCVAECNFLTEMDRYLAATGAAGACGRCVPVCPNTLARAVAACNAEGLRLYFRPDDWRKMNIHAAAVRRTAYLDAGGLNPRYGIFAEMVLAAELWRRGHRAGYADRAAVRHLFGGSAPESVEYNRDAVGGEIRYYRDHPNGPAIGHTFLADGDAPWSARELEWAAFAALRAHRRDAGRTGEARRQWLRAARVALAEGRVGRWLDRFQVYLFATLCGLMRPTEHARRVYLRSWAAAARLARKELLAAEPEPARAADALSLAIDEIPERDLWGFHLPERWQGRTVRWTGRCAVLRLPRPRGELSLLTYGIGWPADGRVRSVHIDGRRLPPEAVSVEWNRVRVRCGPTPGRGPMLLAIVCDPVGPDLCGDEPRELGIPILRVEDEPEAGARRAAA